MTSFMCRVTLTCQGYYLWPWPPGLAKGICMTLTSWTWQRYLSDLDLLDLQKYLCDHDLLNLLKVSVWPWPPGPAKGIITGQEMTETGNKQYPFDTLAPREIWIKIQIFKLILLIDSWGISHEIAMRWMSLNLADGKSTMVQVMAGYSQTTSQYLQANVDPDLCHHITLLGHNELTHRAQAKTKWPPFCKWNFRMNFLTWKFFR